MTQDINSSVTRYNEPAQVDLIALAKQLWCGKKEIMLAIIIMLALAIGYIFLAKEKWISTAIITRPDAGQITDYTNAMNVLYGANAPKITETQESFIERFSSSFSALSESLSNKVEPEKLTIDQAVKGQSLPLKVTFTGSNAEEASKTLAQYIQQVDDDVAKGLEADLVASIKARAEELSQSLSIQETVAKEQKELRIAQITQALTVAQQSNIKNPQVQQAEQTSPDTMFMLGSEALSSMVKNEASRPLPLTDTYYQTRQSLLDITNLLNGRKNEAIKAENLHAYRYVMKPSVPVRRDSPKRGVLLVFAVLLGGLLGTCFVLGRNAIYGHR